MNDLLRWVDWLAPLWSPAMLRASVQGGIALLLAWLVCRTFKKLPPAFKCWLLRLAYLKLLVSLFWQTPIALRILPPEPAAAPLREMVRVEPPVLALPVTATTKNVDSHAYLNDLPFGLWMLGTGCAAALLGVRWRAARRLRKSGLPLDDAFLRREYQRLVASLSITRPPLLLMSNHISSPLLVGLFRPSIILPDRLITSDLGRLRLILAHELAHHRRRDLPWALLPLCGRILFWFHPALWLAEREWWVARESACDALALRATGASAREYGQALLDAIDSFRGAAQRFVAAGVFDSRSNLKRRLSAMRYASLGSQRRWILVGSALLVTSAVALVPLRITAQSTARAAANATTSQPASASTAAANQQDWKDALSYNGDVIGRSWVARPSIDGVISKVNCNPGQTVKQGDVLFELQDTTARAEVRAAEAELKIATANAADAVQRVKVGIADKSPAEAAAQGDVAAAKLAIAQAALNQTRIFSPISGVVSKCSANMGDVVSRAADLATVVQLDPISIEVAVPQSAYAQVKVGEDVRVHCSALGNDVVPGKVSFVSPELSPLTGTGRVSITVGNGNGKLKSGMSVKVEIVVSQTQSEASKKH